MSKKEEKLAVSGGLRYIGDGSALDDIPARDLSQDEAQTLIERIPELLASGLYVPASTPESEA